MFLRVVCSLCNKTSAISVNTKLQIKSTQEALNIKHLWETHDCSLCRSRGTLVRLPTDLLKGKRLSVKGKNNLGGVMKQWRDPSTRTRKPSAKFARLEELAAESDFDDDVVMGEEDDEELIEMDDEYKEETGGAGFAGTIGRLNTQPYSGNYTQPPAGLAGLKSYVIPPGAQQVAKGSRVGTQGRTMGQHYSAQGPLSKKVFVAKLKSSNGSLSATAYGQFFAKRVQGGPKFKQVATRTKENRHATFEWCHGMACSIGGSNSYQNLYAASYDANTFSCVIEDWLRKHINDVTVWINIQLYYEERVGVESAKSSRTSARRAPAYFTYELSTAQTMQKKLQFYVDCRCQGFNAADRTQITTLLDRHFGIPMDHRGS